MNEKNLYLSIIYFLVNHEKLRLEKRTNQEVWFRNTDNIVYVLERNDFPWKRQYIERTQKFLLDFMQTYAVKERMPQVIRVTFAKRVPYEFTDQKDIVRFRSGQMFHYIVSEKISQEKFSKLGMEFFHLSDPVTYLENTDQIEKEFFQLPVTEPQISEVSSKNMVMHMQKKAVVNPIFIIIIVASFFLWQKMESSDLYKLIDLGAKFNPLIVEGEWWRFITPVFLHSGILHLGMNMIAMYYIGQDVERFYGKWRYITIFILSLLGGSIASFLLNTNVSIGASGAVFGLFGAVLYICQYYKSFISPVYRRNMFMLIGFNILFGFLLPGIDQMAHLGGFCVGFFTGVALGFPKQSFDFKRLTLFGFLLLFLVGFYILGVIKNTESAENDWLAGDYYVQKSQYEKAYIHIEKSIEKGISDQGTAYFQLGYVQANLHEYEKAIESFTSSLTYDNRNELTYFNLALVYAELSQYEKALQMIQKALEFSPQNQNYIALKDQILKQEAID